MLLLLITINPRSQHQIHPLVKWISHIAVLFLGFSSVFVHVYVMEHSRLRGVFGYWSLSMWPSGTNTVKTQLWLSSPLIDQTSTMEARASVCLRGLNPTLHPRLMQFDLFTLWSHGPRSFSEALAEAVSFPVPPLSLSADVKEVYLYLEGLCFLQLHQ